MLMVRIMRKKLVIFLYRVGIFRINKDKIYYSKDGRYMFNLTNIFGYGNEPNAKQVDKTIKNYKIGLINERS